MADRRYISIPGNDTHELPPLLVRRPPQEAPMKEVLDMATGVVEGEDLLADTTAEETLVEQRKFDLALNLVDRYMTLLSHWQWGDSILEWIRQCEITFETVESLRSLLHPDVWPHASRSSFVTLLVDKDVPTSGVAVEKAVGLRLTFRQPPPIACFSDQFLIYLNSCVADSAYHTWSHMNTDMPALLPPERFHFNVFDLTKESGL